MTGGKNGWAENARIVNGLFWSLCVLCALLVIVDPFVHREAHMRWEVWFAFPAAFGFVSYAFIVFAGKAVRKVLMRDEDYYDR